MIDLQRERAHLAEAEQEIVDIEIQVSFVRLRIERAEAAGAPAADARITLSNLLAMIARLHRERRFLLGALCRRADE